MTELQKPLRKVIPKIHPAPPQPVFRLREKEVLAYFVASVLNGLLSGCMRRPNFKDEEFNVTSSKVEISGEKVDALCEVSAKIGFKLYQEYRKIVEREEAVNKLNHKVADS
jgi:hypothetical protein